MYRPSFFRRDVQPPPPVPPHPEHPMSPVSVIQRPNSSEKSPEATKEVPQVQIQIPEDPLENDHDDTDGKREKARKAAKYLKLIVHCQVCIVCWPLISFLQILSNIYLLFHSFSQRCNGKCNTLICKKTRLLLNHCAPCQNRDKCPIKGCFQTKKLLCHMIACKFERKQAKQSGNVPKECHICSAVENNTVDDPQDSLSPDSSGREHSLDMDGFSRPMLPRRYRSNTQVNMDTSPGMCAGGSGYNCRSFSVEEESEEMDEDNYDGGIFRSRRVSI